ncbi:alpha/beta hydrolase [Aquibacillus sediminis]|uniref:alpha/beta hydrolase n=1 Tax=Aquibacillus sediminis TaxID=2574734 RepID=UPI001486502B|nr:alpha/beta hydrolase [Aquibacillus sediminis]
MVQSEKMQNVINRLARNNPNLDFQTPVTIDEDLQRYLQFYELDHEQVDLYFGKIERDQTEITVQTFAPKQSKGTVILLHGYLDHVGSLKHIIRYLNDHHYTVVSYDLQGHGLSGGEIASIDQFADYVSTLEFLMEKVKQEMPSPLYAIGHSTGGAIVANYVLKHTNHAFEKVILVAPVVRSNFWWLTKLGVFLVQAFPFIRKVKRQFRQNSSNRDYLDWVRNDPLQPEKIPLDWTKALIAWNKTMQTFHPVATKTCIIQGTADDTVDWKYNVSFLTKKFPDSKVVYIEQGRHALFNESKPIRNQVCGYIHEFLNE